jgi:hypothetical protein
MEASLGYRQAYISQQLMVLRDAGLIGDRRDGWNIYYRVVMSEIYSVIDKVAQVTNQPSKMRNRLARSHIRQANCPCPKCASQDETAGRSKSETISKAKVAA